jgi:15-cis-phytoene synthase
MTPDQYCQDKAARSGSSFYYSFLFLPPERRRAITALYAFCREVDDIVDECTDTDIARTKLAWWRTEITSTFGGTAQHPVTLALAPAISRFQLPQADLHAVIEGMEMDLQYNRYPDFVTLQTYCYRVAGVVGRMAARIFGYSEPATLSYAEQLGQAFQLTNIIRDVGEDARRNRVYLPLDELARFDVTAADIVHLRESEGFRRLMEFQVERARQCYDQAIASLPEQDRRSQRAGLIMAGIYRALLEEIVRDGSRVLNQRTSLTPMRKLWIAWRVWLTA